MTVVDAERQLAVEGLSTTAGAFRLNPIDLHVDAGRVLVVLGPSGAGKTTLLDTIAGFRSAAAGRVRLAGRDVTGLAPERRRIGVVFQHGALFPHLSVRENVGFGLRARAERDDQRVERLLTRFGLAQHTDRHPRSLSGGERQRVALARALAADPDLLLLDEPLSALDQPSREELRGVLQALLDGLGIPAVHVTHDRDEALSLADDVAVIVDGQLRQVEAAHEIVSRPTDGDVARLLGWAELGEGTLEGGRVVLGDLLLGPEALSAAHRGPASVFYRPEAVVLSHPRLPDAPRDGVIRTIEQILPTVPLARVRIAGDPPLTALVLHRELARRSLTAGDRIEVHLPADAVKAFPHVRATATPDAEPTAPAAEPSAPATERRIPSSGG